LLVLKLVLTLLLVYVGTAGMLEPKGTYLEKEGWDADGECHNGLRG